MSSDRISNRKPTFEQAAGLPLPPDPKPSFGGRSGNPAFSPMQLRTGLDNTSTSELSLTGYASKPEDAQSNASTPKVRPSRARKLGYQAPRVSVTQPADKHMDLSHRANHQTNMERFGSTGQGDYQSPMQRQRQSSSISQPSRNLSRTSQHARFESSQNGGYVPSMSGAFNGYLSGGNRPVHEILEDPVGGGEDPQEYSDSEPGSQQHHSPTKESHSFHPSSQTSPTTQNSLENQRSELLALLKTHSSVKLPQTVHRYSIRYVDVQSGKTSFGIRKLVSNTILRELGNLGKSNLPAEVMQVGVGTFITLGEWRLPDIRGKESDGGDALLQNTVFPMLLHDAQKDSLKSGKPRFGAEYGYSKVIPGVHNGGKVEGKWLKVEGLQQLHTTSANAGARPLSDWSSEQRDESVSAILRDQVRSPEPLDPHQIGVWFEHRPVDVKDVGAILAGHGRASQQHKNDIEAVVQGLLKGELASAGMRIVDVLSSGTRVFTNHVRNPPTDAEGNTQLIPSSLV